MTRGRGEGLIEGFGMQEGDVIRGTCDSIRSRAADLVASVSETGVRKRMPPWVDRELPEIGAVPTFHTGRTGYKRLETLGISRKTASVDFEAVHRRGYECEIRLRPFYRPTRSI